MFYDPTQQEPLRAFAMMRGAQVGVLETQCLSDYAKRPTYGSSHAAGLDLYAAEVKTIPPGEWKAIKTGIAIGLPPGTYGRVAPRSGLAYKHGIDVLAGVIDEDYRGEVMVILVNHGQFPFEAAIGDRVAQLIVEKYIPVLVKEVRDFTPTGRGADGFGSTGR
jgi:dUTP pyrophosphatase